MDTRIIARGLGDWLTVGCEGVRGVQDDANFLLGEWVDPGTTS